MATVKVLTINSGNVKEESVSYFPEIAVSESDAGKMVVVNEAGDGFALTAVPEGSSGGITLGMLIALS